MHELGFEDYSDRKFRRRIYGELCQRTYPDQDLFGTKEEALEKAKCYWMLS